VLITFLLARLFYPKDIPKRNPKEIPKRNPYNLIMMQYIA
jgi:hypothetical protein